MSKLSDIVNITISRETKALKVSSFGIPGIISEFPSTKTTTVFDRYRYYSDIDEMLDDGWVTTDREYQRALKIFSQPIVVEKVLIGRKKPKNEVVESWTTALNAIKDVIDDWYCFTINSTADCTVVFNIDFVTGNIINFNINNTVIPTVNFNTDQSTTMTAIKNAIEATIAGAEVTITLPHTLKIEIENTGILNLTAVVTGGLSQPVATISYETDDDIKEVAAWTETQTKIFFETSNDPDIITSTTTDIASELQALGYFRTVINYHPNVNSNNQYFSEGWMGEALPYDPGSEIWALKTISALSVYNLTGAQRTYALNKNANIYTETAGVNITENGKVVGTLAGEYIDIIRDLDWLKARIAENIFLELINSRKIPYTDQGISIIEGRLKEVLDQAVVKGMIAKDYTVSVPRVANISSATKLQRLLPDVKFFATATGAIQKVNITGVVSI